MTNHDPINRPAHYAEGRAFEPIDVIADWELGYHLGNVVKYVSRAGRKQNCLEDLKKARWYLSREIETLEAAEDVPSRTTYEEVVQALIENAQRGYEDVGQELINEYGVADVDDQPLDDWDWDDAYMWDPSLGPVEITEEEVQQILSKKDLEQFQEDEIVSTVERRGLIIGFKKDGSSCLLNTKGRCE
jgi:hypothetical protein